MTASAEARPLRWHPPATLAAVVGWLFALGVLGYLCYRGATGPMRDLQVYRDGALAIRRGHSLYAMTTETGLPFTYPPVGAVLALALTVVPFGLAKLVWSIVMVCVPLGIAVWFGFRQLIARPRNAAGRATVFAAILGCVALVFPVRQEFYFGQVDLFLVALCLLDCAARQPKWPRGLLIGLATAIKLEPGVFIIYLLITRRRRDAAVAALSFAIFSALAFLVSPHDSITYWTSVIFKARRIGGPGSAADQSLYGMVLRAFKPQHAPTSIWLAVALVVAVAGFAAARSCWLRGNDMAGIAITGLLAAALSPIAWIHHYCWVVVAIGVITGDARSRLRVATALVTFALFVTMLPTQAQTMINSGRLAVFPGRELEDAFGLAALALIVIMWRMRSRADLELGERAGAPPVPLPSAPLSGASPAEQVPSGSS